jgi:hypothetical protein
MIPSGVAALFVLAAVVVGCGSGGREAPPRPDRPPAAEPVEPAAKGPAAWTPAEGEERPAYVEETTETADAFRALWARRAKGEPPAVDFATHRVVWVAQEAKHAGYGGAFLKRVQRSTQGTIVEYGAVEPTPGRMYAQVHRGYGGFYAVVPRALPREGGGVVFHRHPERR